MATDTPVTTVACPQGWAHDGRLPTRRASQLRAQGWLHRKVGLRFSG